MGLKKFINELTEENVRINYTNIHQLGVIFYNFKSQDEFSNWILNIETPSIFKISSKVISKEPNFIIIKLKIKHNFGSLGSCVLLSYFLIKFLLLLDNNLDRLLSVFLIFIVVNIIWDELRRGSFGLVKSKIFKKLYESK